jgi:beta-phosphoglucomutase-like phosphatase (HAD superfamily)
MVALREIVTSETVFFFDLDGTLVDTDFANFLAYKMAIERVIGKSIVFNPQQRFNRAQLKTVFNEISDSQFSEIIRLKEMQYSGLLSETKLISDIANFLFRYYKSNKTILVTNSRKSRAMETLNYHCLTDKFHCFFFQENNTTNNKFQIAITQLGISPKNVIAFENESEEIKKAKNIGVETIINSTYFKQ